MPFFALLFLCSIAILAMSWFVVVPQGRLVLTVMALGGMAASVWSARWFLPGWPRRLPQHLVIHRRAVAVFHKGRSQSVLHIRGISRFRVRRVGKTAWRVRFGVPGRRIDVVIECDARTMAAVRALLKQRMGHVGVTGWGTRVRRRTRRAFRTGLRFW